MSESLNTQEAWVLKQKAQYGPREDLSAWMYHLARSFNRELSGLSGPIIEDMLSISPHMVPCVFWGGDLGWRSQKKHDRWATLLERNCIPLKSSQVGILVRFYMNAAEWVPHPYAPPFWTLSNFELFSEHIIADEKVFELCRTWHRENSILLTQRLSQRLQKHGVSLGASYRCLQKTDFAEVAFQFPQSCSAIDVATVWRGETELAQLVRSIFPDAIREYSADWLRGQRLDIFVPSRNLAFEYQGQQHYQPIEYFGGNAGFSATIDRDSRKRTSCSKAGVVLIEWKYNEVISRERLLEKLQHGGIDVFPS